MNSQFDELIRTRSEKQHLYLRKVAPLLEMDTAQLSKIEKGMRQYICNALEEALKLVLNKIK